MESKAYNARQDGVFCDACSAQIGQSPMPLSHSSPITVDLGDWRNPTSPQKTHHFCNSICLQAHLETKKMEQENHAHAGQANASHQHKIICNGCHACIAENEGESDMSPPVLPHKAVRVELPDEDGSKKMHHFCSENCMAEHLEKRQKMKKESMASLDQVQLKIDKSTPYWSVNLLQSDGRNISYKERNSPKEWFIDEKRKSFPVMNCKDVSAVMHRIGTYKGEMSTEEIRSKLKRRAVELGCTHSLPAADKNKD